MYTHSVFSKFLQNKPLYFDLEHGVGMNEFWTPEKHADFFFFDRQLNCQHQEKN